MPGMVFSNRCQGGGTLLSRGSDLRNRDKTAPAPIKAGSDTSCHFLFSAAPLTIGGGGHDSNRAPLALEMELRGGLGNDRLDGRDFLRPEILFLHAGLGAGQGLLHVGFVDGGFIESDVG